MLKFISSDVDFLANLNFNYSSLDNSQKIRLSISEYNDAYLKIKSIAVDLILDELSNLYSHTGRPAIDPCIFIRSFILMSHFKYTSIHKWVNNAKNDSLLSYLIGATSIPSVSSHYDFINRLLSVDPKLDDLDTKNKNFNKRIKPKKNQKEINFTSEATCLLRDKYIDNFAADNSRNEYTLQSVFNKLVVIPSLDSGLIDSNELILSGDGTSLHIHANPNGHRVIDSDDFYAKTHRYGAPEADIGWDSDLNKFYFGYSVFNISYHNPSLKVDLPVFFSIDIASQHDAKSSIIATAQMFEMNSDLKPKYMCFDSASDNYATHEFLNYYNTIGIIDINKRSAKNIYATHKLSENGNPICGGNHEMKYEGYSFQRERTKYRCPFVTGKISTCSNRDNCSKSKYGKVVHIHKNQDIKLFGPVPFRSNKWIEIYKNRTSTERINNRLLNDYRLHSTKVKNKSKIYFFTIMAGINIHLDAKLKVTRLNS